MEAGASNIKDYVCTYNKVETSLNYMRPYLKKKKKKPNYQYQQQQQQQKESI